MSLRSINMGRCTYVDIILTSIDKRRHDLHCVRRRWIGVDLRDSVFGILRCFEISGVVSHLFDIVRK